MVRLNRSRCPFSFGEWGWMWRWSMPYLVTASVKNTLHSDPLSVCTTFIRNFFITRRRKTILALQFATSLVIANPYREYTSSAVYTYFLVPGRPRCTVSNSTKSPGFSTSGSGGYFRVFFQGLRFLRREYLPSTRFTDESETVTPSRFKYSCITSEHLLCSMRAATIFAMISFESEWGCFFGLELRVSMRAPTTIPAFLHHFTIQLCVYPKCRATARVLDPLRIILTAWARTRAMFSLFVYVIFIV